MGFIFNVTYWWGFSGLSVKTKCTMKFIVIIILIVFWWFIVGATLTSMVNDSFISGESLTGNNSYTVGDATVFNSSGVYNEDASKKSFLDMSVRMFTFRVPTSLLPTGFNAFLSFLNWFLLILMVVSIYRLANPLS